MLGLHIFFAFLAGFGLFSLLWAVMGFFLPHARDGQIICTGKAFWAVYLWLRGFGLVTCPLIMLDEGLDEETRRFIQSKDIELHSRESLISLLGKDTT